MVEFGLAAAKCAEAVPWNGQLLVSSSQWSYCNCRGALSRVPQALVSHGYACIDTLMCHAREKLVEGDPPSLDFMRAVAEFMDLFDKCGADSVDGTERV